MYEKVSIFTNNDLYLKYCLGLESPDIEDPKQFVDKIKEHYEKNFPLIIKTDKFLSFNGSTEKEKLIEIMSGLSSFFTSIVNNEIIINLNDLINNNFMTYLNLFKNFNIVIDSEDYYKEEEKLLYAISLLRAKTKGYFFTLIINSKNIDSVLIFTKKMIAYKANLVGYIDLFDFSTLEKSEFISKTVKLIEVLKETKATMKWPEKNINIFPNKMIQCSPFDTYFTYNGETIEVPTGINEFIESTNAPTKTKIIYDLLKKEE